MLGYTYVNFQPMSNTELVEKLIVNDGVKVVNTKGYGRLESDVIEALESLLYDYEETKYQNELNSDTLEYAIKHIKKLEKMLDKRNVNYKTWNEVTDDEGLTW